MAGLMSRCTLKYPHVLYCMNNETGEPVEWSDFWALHVRSRAAAAGQSVETAEMRRSGNITTPDHRHRVDHPDLYTFLDAGATCDDERPARQGQLQRVALAGGKILAGLLLTPDHGFVEINRRECRGPGAQLFDPGRDNLLRPFQVWEEDQFLPADGFLD